MPIYIWTVYIRIHLSSYTTTGWSYFSYDTLTNIQIPSLPRVPTWPHNHRQVSNWIDSFVILKGGTFLFFF